MAEKLARNALIFIEFPLETSGTDVCIFSPKVHDPEEGM